MKNHWSVKNKTVLIIAALPSELASIKKECKNNNIPGLKLKFFLSWVWNYNTIYNLKNHIDHLENTPDFIINIWLCGKITKASSSFFQVYRIFWAANQKESLCPIYINFLKKESILSSEKVITNEKNMQWENYVDMESYAIDLVATQEKIPYVIIKKPFDSVSEKSKSINIKLYQDCLSDLKYHELFKSILAFLQNHEDAEEILRSHYLRQTLELYTFTFSEKEIWKKWYARCIALWWNYENFLNENKRLTKNNFLKTLGIYI